MNDNAFSGNSVLDDLYGGEEVTTEDLTPKASRTVNKAGFYHGVVMSKKDENPDHEGINSVVLLGIQLLAGEHADQKDAMYFHRIRLFRLKHDEKDKSKVIGREAYSKDYRAQQLRAAIGLGLLPLEAGVKLSQVNWDNALGAQTILKIDADKEKYKDKTTGEDKESLRYQVNFGNFFRLDDPQVAHVPKDGEAIAMLTGGAGIGDDQLAGI